MANDLLMLINLDTDATARLSLIVSSVAVIVSLASAIAAIFAAFYCKRAATKDDKKTATKDDRPRIEPKTQRLEHVSNEVSRIDTGMPPQEEQEALQARAQRVSISVEGEAVGEVPLELHVTLQDSAVRVRRVEMLDEAGSSLGSSPCKATDNALVFKSILAPEKVRQWWDAGESTSDGGARSVLRVYLLLGESGREVYREMPVSIVEGLSNVGIADLVVWTIKGSI